MMKAIKVVFGAVGFSAIIAIAGNAQISSLAANDRLKAETVADTIGNLRVPDAYRTTYEFLGT